MLELSPNPLETQARLTGQTHFRQIKKRRLLRLRREKAAAEQIVKLPDVGEELAMIMTGNFHGWDLVAAVLDLSDSRIDHLRVATLGFNRAQTDHLCELLDDGWIKRLTMVVSEMFREKNHAEFETLRQAMADRGQRVVADRNHAKLLCFDLESGQRLVAHGSLNLRRCRSYEQVVISNDPPMHDFFARFIDSMGS